MLIFPARPQFASITRMTLQESYAYFAVAVKPREKKCPIRRAVFVGSGAALY